MPERGRREAGHHQPARKTETAPETPATEALGTASPENRRQPGSGDGQRAGDPPEGAEPARRAEPARDGKTPGTGHRQP
ncbi:hypothetical protein GCM10010245_85160 [Streptomyces spectabilis]|nr:hypothetical protein GCM10010245_85160 [Streptomyces spectabilis]